MDVGDEIVVDAIEMSGHHRPEQQSAETGRRIDRQHHVPKSDTARRLGRPGVVDLELGEQHLPGRYRQVSPPPSQGSPPRCGRER